MKIILFYKYKVSVSSHKPTVYICFIDFHFIFYTYNLQMYLINYESGFITYSSFNKSTL